MNKNNYAYCDDNPIDALYIEKILNENMKFYPSCKIEEKDNVSLNSHSSSMIPPHRYLFQQLKSNKSAMRKADLGNRSSISSIHVKEFSFDSENNLQQPFHKQKKKPKTMKNWCGRPFFCINQRKKRDSNSTTIEPTTDCLNNENQPLLNNKEELILHDEELIKEHNHISHKHDTPRDMNLLLRSIDEKNLEIDTLKQTINQLNKENQLLFSKNEESQQFLDEKQIDLEELLKQKQHFTTIISEYKEEIKKKDKLIDSYKKEIETQKVNIHSLENKLEMSKATEDILFNKERKESKKLKDLEKAHHSEISYLKDEIKKLEIIIEKKNETYSAAIDKLVSLFDSCKDSHTNTMELHENLEGILSIAEDSLTSYQIENDKLKLKTAEDAETITHLNNIMHEKSILVDELNNLVQTLTLEKLESCYHFWILSFEEILWKLKNPIDGSMNNSLNKSTIIPQAFDTTSKNTIDSNNISTKDNQSFSPSDTGDNRNIVPNENSLSHTNKSSLTLSIAPSKNNSFNKTFEIESVSIEKNFSSSCSSEKE